MIINNKEFYDGFLNKSPEGSPQSVGWGTKKKQLLMFDRLLKVITQFPSNNSVVSILDVGCGLAHLYERIVERKLESKIEYHGIDIHQGMIDRCKEKYPDIADNFRLENITTETGRYDYVIACGAFNLRTGVKKYHYIGNMVTKMVEISNIGVAFNLLSKRGSKDYPNLYYYDPQKVFGRMEFFYGSIIMDTTYIEDDFMVFIKK